MFQHLRQAYRINNLINEVAPLWSLRIFKANKKIANQVSKWIWIGSRARTDLENNHIWWNEVDKTLNGAWFVSVEKFVKTQRKFERVY